MNNKVSILIPTYKRLASLKRLLKSIKLLTNKYYEIIIVEQVFNNKKVILKFAKTNNLPIKYFFIEEPNLTRAINLLVYKSSGEYLLFLDDDIKVLNKLIDYHLSNFIDRSVAATVGRCLTLGQQVEANRVNTGKITFFGRFTDGFSSKYRQKVDTVLGCNMCWRKQIFLELGGVDERYTGNALRWESDLSMRAKGLGYQIIFEPHAKIFHFREESGGTRKKEGRIKWYHDFFSNEVYFFLKFRSIWVLPFFLFTKLDWAIKCMFGFGRELSVRSLLTPLLGIIDGFKKYKSYSQSYDYRR